MIRYFPPRSPPIQCTDRSRNGLGGHMGQGGHMGPPLRAMYGQVATCRPNPSVPPIQLTN